MAQRNQIYHLIWKYPQQPSKLKEASLHENFYRELHRLRKAGVLLIHRYFLEQHHLDLLISFRTDDHESVFRRLKEKMNKLLERNISSGPLYFEAQTSDGFDRYEKAKSLQVSDSYYDPLPSSLRLELRPLGESRRFILHQGGQLSWPARRVFYLQTL